MVNHFMMGSARLTAYQAVFPATRLFDKNQARPAGQRQDKNKTSLPKRIIAIERKRFCDYLREICHV